MFSINLYTTDPAALQREKIEAALAVFDYHRPVKVSRTVGPTDWFTLNKRALAGEESVAFPAKDIDQAAYTSLSEISALSQPQSVLTISCAGAESTRLQILANALYNDMPVAAKGFFISSTLFSFGPSDIVADTDDEDGQPDVTLVDIAQFIFSLSCDRFRGRVDPFKTALSALEEFVRLRRNLEQIVGPLSLHFSR